LLYQALYSYQDARQRITNWGGLTHENILLFQRGATEDLGMWFVETESGLHGGVTYNTDIFIAQTAKDLRDGYLAMVDGVIDSPSANIGELASPLRATLKQAENVPIAASRESHARNRESLGTPPRSDTEKLLAQIWCDLLKIPSVVVEDNFFDLGGHSLLAMQSILSMEEKTGKRVDRSRFIFETLAQIAKSYDDAVPEPVEKKGGLRSLFSGLLGGKKS
ncbi:MAG: phosphopantetheine-binding protein, partial [Usitatibacteraceae bacterium]